MCQNRARTAVTFVTTEVTDEGIEPSAAGADRAGCMGFRALQVDRQNTGLISFAAGRFRD